MVTVLLAVIMSLPLKAQEFTFQDTAVAKGDIMTLYLLFYAYRGLEPHGAARANLDSVVTFMKSLTNITVEVGAHTDSRATRKYNEPLSEKRAYSIVDYLKSEGIAADRLTAKGYGELRPLIPDREIKKMRKEEKMEHAHQTNRRITLTITSIEYGQRK